MKVLHLYSNHKWTGPAELCLLWAQAFPEARLAKAGWVHPGMEHAIEKRAAELAVPLREGLELRRHVRLGALLRDAGTLATWIDGGEVDLLHCHQAGDHLVAALALQLSQRRIPLVRTVWGEGDLHPGPRQWIAFSASTAVSHPPPRLAPRLRPLANLSAMGDSHPLHTPPPIDLS
ncbi:MAG TPA: hypothetical protein ENK02_10130, partial [Planctomycetes bacterium]|nr:hypothetical protein [Planctomycetota bacterium]